MFELPCWICSVKEIQITSIERNYCFKNERRYYFMNYLMVWSFITLNYVLTATGRQYYCIILKRFCKSRCIKFKNLKRNQNLRIDLKSPDRNSHRKLSRTFNAPNIFCLAKMWNTLLLQMWKIHLYEKMLIGQVL